MKQKVIAQVEGFNVYDIIGHLHSADLIIHTLPGEEWTLSCALHKTLLVDVYTLTRKDGRVRTYQCGRLCELLLRVLCTGHTLKYHSYLPMGDGTLAAYAYSAKQLAETIEEDTMIRLRCGDIRFFLPQGVWRLSNTTFGKSLSRGSDLFHFAQEETLERHARYFVSTRLEHILLEFLCQDSTFIPHMTQTNILAFMARKKE